MSLDCYPFGKRRIINLTEQPMALDVAYNDDLFLLVTDQCQSIVVYDLSAGHRSNLIRKFSLGKDIVVDQIIYCRTGDYLACVGHKNGLLSVYTIFQWRQIIQDPMILELSVNVESRDQDRRDKLNSIDCCQITGNLAVSCGDTVLIYKYLGDDKEDEEKTTTELANEDADSFHSKADTVKDNTNLSGETDEYTTTIKQHFKHIVSIKLTIWALKICLLENYLSITAGDHVQVLKLELLTLQIQSDGSDPELQVQTNNQASNIGFDPINFNAAQSETTSTSTTIATSCSMISDSNSTTTNFSSFNNNTGEQLNNSDMSIITMNQQHQYNFESEINDDSTQSTDDCITWNLNTKKLVKLPTLMHNTSTNLSSYHICHPLELLGPASESIACRVSPSIYSIDFCQNQLEAVVMLCKQFDSDNDPVKSTYLQAVYLSSYEDQKRLNKSALNTDHDFGHDQTSGYGKDISLFKSSVHELLVSVTCFVSTLTNCFVYTLHGKKVVRTQTITHPDLCLDFRPDLLNVYLLTSLGLQICSSGICDSTFRYDWSSSSDLNLSFIAADSARVLTTSNFIIMVACSVNGQCVVEYMEKPHLESLYNRIVYTVNRCNSISIRSNMLTYLHAMAQLKLLTQSDSSLSPTGNSKCSTQKNTVNILKVVTIMLCKQLLQKKQTNVITNSRIDKTIKHLLDISFCDLMELMKRHLNSINLLHDINVESDRLNCIENSSDEDEDLNQEKVGQMILSDENCYEPVDLDCTVMTLGDDDKPLDTDYELIKIYLKYAKYSQSLLDYLVSNSSDVTFCTKIIGYMFELNPRLLIKCAQRYPLNIENETTDRKADFCVMLLVEKLKKLAEFDSTGINRATVLFTLAILYNSLEEKQKCLAALGQIKPLNHLAITMCSNYELSHSIASVVYENYRDVFNLFLIQLVKRDKLAAKEFANIYNNNNSNLEAMSEEDESWRFWRNKSVQGDKTTWQLGLESEAESDSGRERGPDFENDDESELYEMKLKLVADIPTIELVELLVTQNNDDSTGGSSAEKLSNRGYLEASINLLESQFILARLRENSH